MAWICRSGSPPHNSNSRMPRKYKHGMTRFPEGTAIIIATATECYRVGRGACRDRAESQLVNRKAGVKPLPYCMKRGDKTGPVALASPEDDCGCRGLGDEPGDIFEAIMKHAATTVIDEWAFAAEGEEEKQAALDDAARKDRKRKVREGEGTAGLSRS